MERTNVRNTARKRRRIPLAQMPEWGRWLAPFSPLSYCADLIRIGFGEGNYWSTRTEVLALCAFIMGLMLLAARWHRRTHDRAV